MPNGGGDSLSSGDSTITLDEVRAMFQKEKEECKELIKRGRVMFRLQPGCKSTQDVECISSIIEHMRGRPYKKWVQALLECIRAKCKEFDGSPSPLEREENFRGFAKHIKGMRCTGTPRADIEEYMKSLAFYIVHFKEVHPWPTDLDETCLKGFDPQFLNVYRVKPNPDPRNQITRKRKAAGSCVPDGKPTPKRVKKL
jgi:hypothetical protein